MSPILGVKEIERLGFDLKKKNKVVRNEIISWNKFKPLLKLIFISDTLDGIFFFKLLALLQHIYKSNFLLNCFMWLSINTLKKLEVLAIKTILNFLFI